MAKGKKRRGRQRRNGTGNLAGNRRRRNRAGDSLTRSLHLEQLEDRRLLATFEVVTIDDIRQLPGEDPEVVPGSLRDAVQRANAADDRDTIIFTGIAFEGPTIIALERVMDDFGELVLEGPVDIIGPGASKLTVQAAPGRRVFRVDNMSDESFDSVTISGLSLTGNGAIAGDDADGRGGVIHNKELLRLQGLDVSNGSAPNGGGGIFSENGSLTVEGSLIRDNVSGQGGGGIQNGLVDQTENFSRARIVNSTITGNVAQGIPGEMGADTGYGGGLFNLAGEVDIDQSTVYGNMASVTGGGVASQGFDPMIDSDSMMPTVYGGAATLNIHGSIIAGNTVPVMGMPTLDDVGSSGMTAGDNNADPPVEPGPADPQINSTGYNLFGVLTHPPTTNSMDVVLPGNGMNDMTDVDPTTIFIDNGGLIPVAVLGDYGGDTRVFMPDPNKPGGMLAIDHGDPNAVSGAFDQRGRHFRRVAPDPTLDVIDIGAAEVQDGIFVVDTLLDESDGEYREGDFSLREAIEFSEKNPFRDTVSFSQSVRLDPDPNPFTPAPTIVLTLGELRITEGVNIQGPTFQFEIDGNLSSRIFNVDDGDGVNAIDVTISDLTLFDGGGVVNGGAIVSSENLTLRNMYIRNSNAALNGGALAVVGGIVDGVAVPGGTATIESSTFSQNNAANIGGAIFVDEMAGTVDIVNSTISENSSSNRGAGLANVGPDTSVRHSTITLNNAASTRASGIGNLGAGVLSIYSSIVAANLNNDIEFFGGPITNITSDGYNLVGVGNADSLFNGIIMGDRNGILDPKLAPLAFTGGPTPTHRILADSLALDAGELGVAVAPAFDQRGEPQFVRIFDGDVDGTAQIDIGSYELQEVTYTVDVVVDENDGVVSAGNLSLREAINIANASTSPLPETIVFDPLLAGSTFFLSPNVVDSTPDVKITGPLSIIGPTIIINGSSLGGMPMFTVDDGDDATAVPVSFDGLAFEAGSGRALVSKEDVDLDDIIATGNAGVVAHSLGTLTIRTSVMTGNMSSDDGGAVAVSDGNLVIEGATSGYGYTLITGNSTTASGGNGGAVSFTDGTTDGKSLTVSKTIIAGNQAPAGDSDGAGLYISGNGSSTVGARTEAAIVDSVISGNITTGSNSEGAGLFTKDADVTLTGVTVSLNKSFGTNSKGAGIYLNGGKLTIENSASGPSLITQNTSYGNYASGAGIANIGGDLMLSQVTISRNTTEGSNTHGAGIYSTGGNLALNGTTVSENVSAASGGNAGGIYSMTNLSGTQKTTIFNSTVSGNTASVQGAGVYNAGGLLEITYSTISNNSVPFFGNGAGVASLGNASTTRTEVRSSIIAGNHATNDPVNPNSDIDVVNGLSGSVVSLGYNVIGIGLPLSKGAFNQMGDQVDIVDPGLGPLGTINGGLTATHALLPTSPAINAGDPNAVANVGNVPEFDQRGESRVQNGRIDVGAYESDLSPISTGLAADFDGDNDTDGSDFLAWQRGFGIMSGAAPGDGDADGDGAVGASDLVIWQNEFATMPPAPVAAQSTNSGGGAVASVSETSEPLQVAAVSDSNSELTGLSLGSPADSESDLVTLETSVEASTIARDQLFAALYPVVDSSVYEALATSQTSGDGEDSELELSVEDQIFESIGSGVA